MLNMLHQQQHYKNFQMESRGPQINHLSFADDIIIFSSTTRDTLHMIMKTLATYESVSDQLINKDKSHFMVPSNAPIEVINVIVEITGFTQKNSPITYLGCPLYIGGQKIIYYSDLVAKITKRITDGNQGFLVFVGTATMIKHILQSIPIHTMSTTSPPKTTICYIEKAMADFFWGWDKEKIKYHWASWDTLCLPLDEGGIGIRRLEDVFVFHYNINSGGFSEACRHYGVDS